jgi:hypothetical protein
MNIATGSIVRIFAPSFAIFLCRIKECYLCTKRFHLAISSVVSKVLGAGEILTLSLSKGPIGAESKDLTLAPLAGLLFVRLALRYGE